MSQVFSFCGDGAVFGSPQDLEVASSLDPWGAWNSKGDILVQRENDN
jgi:hypothetical protein